MDAIWAIGDIHGCFKTLRQLVEEKIRPAKRDTLIFLGDYIDRGPASAQVIAYIRQLQADGHSVVALMGNHEESMLSAYEAEFQLRKPFFGRPRNRTREAWFRFGGDATMASFGTDDLKALPTDTVEWLRQLPSYYLTPEFVFVHAGLNFACEDPFADDHALRWTKEFTIDPARIDYRRVVHGHVPVHLELIRDCIEQRYDFIDLDNGCVYKDRTGQGNLVALEVRQLRLEVQPNVDMV